MASCSDEKDWLPRFDEGVPVLSTGRGEPRSGVCGSLQEGTPVARCLLLCAQTHRRRRHTHRTFHEKTPSVATWTKPSTVQSSSSSSINSSGFACSSACGTYNTQKQSQQAANPFHATTSTAPLLYAHKILQPDRAKAERQQPPTNYSPDPEKRCREEVVGARLSRRRLHRPRVHGAVVARARQPQEVRYDGRDYVSDEEPVD